MGTGLGATAFGYFIQGWFKFGGVEFFKIQAVQSLGEEKAWNNKTGIYLGAAACAEFIADIFLCPLEAVRIRSVSDPEFADGLADGFGKMLKSDGVLGFYSGFLPILAKQVPYTMTKFAVQGNAADAIYASMGNKAGAGGDGPMMSRLMNIAGEVGMVNLCTVGLLPRCVMIGTLTAGQFGIFDTVMNTLGASKFHFTDPNEKH